MNSPYGRGGQSTAQKPNPARRGLLSGPRSSFVLCKNLIFFSCKSENVAQRAQKKFETALEPKKLPTPALRIYVVEKVEIVMLPIKMWRAIKGSTTKIIIMWNTYLLKG